MWDRRSTLHQIQWDQDGAKQCFIYIKFNAVDELFNNLSNKPKMVQFYLLFFFFSKFNAIYSTQKLQWQKEAATKTNSNNQCSNITPLQKEKKKKKLKFIYRLAE